MYKNIVTIRREGRGESREEKELERRDGTLVLGANTDSKNDGILL